MRKIYLLRHCETEQFLQKRCIGITDIDLSENGLRHAQCLKEYLADKEVNHIFCSDARRASKTAEIISNGKIPVTKLPALHEINMGDWDGMLFDDIKSKFPEEYKQRGLDFAAFSPPNGENFAGCQRRAIKTLHYILENTEGNIAVVSHAGFNRALICGLCHIELQELFTIPQPFGCVNTLSAQNGICHVQRAGLEIDELYFNQSRRCEMKTGAVIVAAGMSSRMKAFKPLLALCGSTMIGTAIESLRSAGIGEISVVTGNQSEKLQKYLSGTGVICLYNDKYETTDMGYSAKIGLSYLENRCDRVFFLPGDVPLFSKQSLVSMLNDMEKSNCEILLPVRGGKMGHPILISSSAIPFLIHYKGDGGLKGAIDSFAGLKKTIELDDIGMMLDADRPEDYERLKEYAEKRKFER